MNTHTHTHIPFNGPFSGTTRVSRYQKGKTDLDFTEARDSEWQWHQLGQMQVCTSLQTDNHANTHRSVFYRPDALPATQPTASKHWRQRPMNTSCNNWANANCNSTITITLYVLNRSFCTNNAPLAAGNKYRPCPKKRPPFIFLNNSVKN